MTCKHDRRDFCSKARVDLGFGQGGLKILYLFQRILSKIKSIYEIYFQVSWPPLSEFSGYNPSLERKSESQRNFLH